jgi:hypothetical protein
MLNDILETEMNDIKDKSVAISWYLIHFSLGGWVGGR